MHNLTKTLAAVSLLVPVSGHSLGIGGIKLHSALNQNLNAEISLVVSANEKASDIKVSLAPPDKFDEAGVPWASFLSNIKFTTVPGANGSVIIKLSSREAVKEPFLDFLLEVSWPKGSLYREFTVLLDPPAAYKQATLPVLTGSEGYAPEQAFVPQRQSRQRQPVNTGRSLSRVGEYGPTRKNDTLWKVAEQAGRQEGVSVEQMMIAMFAENPRAFYKENVHALSVGKTLKIPEREAILKISRKQALAEFKRQTNSWENRLAPAPIETETEKESPDNQLTLVAPTEADVAGSAIVAPENKQVTAKKVDEALPAATKAIDGQVASTTPPANDPLQNKVAELEKQLAMMQQILALKDQQLATLQNQSQAKPVVQEKPVQLPPGQAEVVPPPVAQQKPVQPVAKPVIQPEPETTAPSNAYYPWIIGGVGMGTLSMLGWLWWQKRKLDEKMTSQSPLISLDISKTPEPEPGPGPEILFSPTIEKDSVKNTDAIGASPLFGEFTFSDFDTFDTDQGEIDPISEADVYLAYGRYQQAEELMRDVIKDQPGRDDYKLKLLEIFYSNENKQAFEAYASELAEAGKEDDIEFWVKVTEMGSEICQDSALFSTGAGAFSSKNSTVFENNFAARVESDAIKKEKEDQTDFDFDESDFNPSSFNGSFNNEGINEMPQTKDNLLDYDLTPFEDEVDDEQKNNESIDFDLSAFATDDTAEPTEVDGSKAQEIEGNGKFEGFEFDLGLSGAETKGSDGSKSAIVGTADESYQRTDILTDKPSSLNYSFADDFFDGDFDKPAAGLNGQDFDQQDRFDVFDLTDMDQLETKLDLAKAYIDMSDTDAAKEMAWEVLEKGTEEQKKIAQALLDDLK